MTTSLCLSLMMLCAVAGVVPGMSASVPGAKATATTGAAAAGGIHSDVIALLLERLQHEAAAGKLPEVIAQLLERLQSATQGGARHGAMQAVGAAALPDLLKQLSARVQDVLREAAADERHPLVLDDDLAEQLAGLLHRLTAAELPDLVSQALQLTDDGALASRSKNDIAARDAKLAKLMPQLLERLQEREEVLNSRSTPSAADARLLELLSQLLDRLHDVEEDGRQASGVDVSQLTRVVDALLTQAGGAKRTSASSAADARLPAHQTLVVRSNSQRLALRRVARRMLSS